MRCSYCGDDVHNGRLVSEDDYTMLGEKINGVDCMVIVHKHCVDAYKAAMAEEGSGLKPCPFCGSEAVEFNVEPIWWYVQCTSEQCKVRMVAHSREEVEGMWNRRVKR